MEQLIDYVFGVLNAFADKYEWLAFALMILGGLYVFLSAIRAFLSKIVRLTPTKKDDKFIGALYAFLDKYAYGFGKLADYYEKYEMPEQTEKAEKPEDK